jgi:hypothetical protein
MTDEQIIQLCESLGISMNTRKMEVVDDADGTSHIIFNYHLHYAGLEIINLVRLMEGRK